jgi:L-asparaginase II
MIAGVLAKLLEKDEPLTDELRKLAHKPIMSRNGAKVGEVRPAAFTD